MMESKLIRENTWSEDKGDKIDWKEEKKEWEKTIKCPHCTHQLKRKKLKKHIANIHPSLYDQSKGSANSSGLGGGGGGFDRNPNRNLPSQPRMPIPQHVKSHIKEMMQCDPWKTKCDYCPYIGENLSRHMLTHTEEGKKILKEEREEIIYCSFCNMETKKKNLRKHIKTSHPNVTGDDTSFNYHPVAQNNPPRRISRPWDIKPEHEVTFKPENKYPGKAPPFVYDNLYGSFNSGGKNSSNASPSSGSFGNQGPPPSGPPGGSFTAGDIFSSQTKQELSNSNRSMNNDYNQKATSFGPPIPGEEDVSQGSGGSWQNGAYRGNQQAGYGNHGGYQEDNKREINRENGPSGHYGNHGGPNGNYGGPSGPNGSYGGPSGPNGSSGGPSGPNGSYDEYSNHGSQYPGTNTSAGSYNKGSYNEGNKGSYNEGAYNKGSYNEASYKQETTPSVGPDYGYGYERNTAPWDSSTSTSSNSFLAQSSHSGHSNSNNFLAQSAPSGQSGYSGHTGQSGHSGQHGGGVGGPGWSGLAGW